MRARWASRRAGALTHSRETVAPSASKGGGKREGETGAEATRAQPMSTADTQRCRSERRAQSTLPLCLAARADVNETQPVVGGACGNLEEHALVVSARRAVRLAALQGRVVQHVRLDLGKHVSAGAFAESGARAEGWRKGRALAAWVLGEAAVPAAPPPGIISTRGTPSPPQLTAQPPLASACRRKCGRRPPPCDRTACKST